MRNGFRIAGLVLAVLVFWQGGWIPSRGSCILLSILALLSGISACAASVWRGNPEIRNKAMAGLIGRAFLDARRSMLPWLGAQGAACAFAFRHGDLLSVAVFFLSLWNAMYFAFNLSILLRNRRWIRERISAEKKG